jgi:hypothetical protein
MKTTASIAADCPPRDPAEMANHATSKKNVRWMRTSVPAIRPSEIDHPIIAHHLLFGSGVEPVIRAKRNPP